MPAPRATLRRRVRWAVPIAVLALCVSGCREPSSEEAPPPLASAVPSAPSAPPAPAPLSPEEVAFPRSTPLLATHPAIGLLPRSVTAVLVVRSPAGVLPGLARFDEARETLTLALDELAAEVGGDLPKVASLVESGLDPTQPIGLVAFEPRLDTLALFASVADEAKLTAWLEQRASRSGGARHVVKAGDAVLLRGKETVGRAVVVRRRQVFFVWTREGRKAEPARVAAWVDDLATSDERASLRADPAFSAAMAALAFGTDGALYVREGHAVAALLAEHERVIDAAPGTTKARREKETMAALAPLEAAVGPVALGFELGDRALEVKAFVARTGEPAQLLDPPKTPVRLFDPAFSPASAVHAVLDPRLLAALRDVAPRNLGKDPLALKEARRVVGSLAVPLADLDSLLDGELATARHKASSKAFTVYFGVRDQAAVHALLDKGWSLLEKTGAARKGLAKRLGEDAFEVPSPGPGALAAEVRLVGPGLLVTTVPSVVDAFAEPGPRALWMSTAEPPELAQLAAIEGVTARIAVDPFPWDPWLRGEEVLSWPILGGTVGGPLEDDPERQRRQALRQRRDAAEDRIRDLEKAHDEHAIAIWRGFLPRVGRVALSAKPTEGGVLIYGGVFTLEPSVRALAEAGLAAWLAAGPKWEKAGELARLREELRSLKAQLDASP